jgi:phage tail protein X
MNDVKGVKWFEKAADQGEPGAFYYLGASYYLGKGVKRDFMQSYKWTSLFKESGHSVITTDPADVDAKLAELEGRLTSKQMIEAKLLEKDLKARLSIFARFSEDDGNKESSHIPEFGYTYPVADGDTLEAVVLAYKSQGVDVTVGQIVAANPGLNLNTKLVAGMKLFIPDKNAKPDNGAMPIQTR